MKARALSIALIGFALLIAFGLANTGVLPGPQASAVIGPLPIQIGSANQPIPDLPTRRASVDDRYERIGSPKETVIDKKFAVRPGEVLEVRNAHSDVIIRTGSGSEARVRVTLSGRNMTRARAFFEHLNFRVEKSGRTLSVMTDPKGRWNGNSGNADIDVYIDIPEVFDADITTRHGDVHAEDLKGEIRFDVAHGDLRAGTLSGSLLTISTRHGDVEAKRLASEKVRIKAHHGDVDVHDITGTEVAISTQHGDVEAGKIFASEITVSTSHGDIDIERLEGYPQISAAHGDISVYLADSRGGTFRNQHGDIDLSASTAVAVDLDLEAPDIDIASPYQFTGHQQRGRIQGQINGGGPKLAAKTSHGHIRLRAN